MSDFTLKSVISDIGKALSEAFPNAAIYVNSVKQGLKLPCFFIQCPSGLTKPFPSQRYYRKYHIVIQYLPADSLNPADECTEVADRLYGCLELIGSEGEYLRGTNLYQEYSDGILNFFVDYGCYLRRESDVSADNEMDGMEGRVTTKGG